MATERDLALAARDAANNGPSTAGLVGGIVSDLQDLVRKEIALARQETLEEIGKIGRASCRERV